MCVAVLAGTLCVLAIPAGALAATTIGDTTIAPVQTCASPLSFFQATSTGPSYTVPAGGGVITSWAYRTGATPPETVKLKVWRPTADPASFTVVSEDRFRTVPANATTSFESRVPAQGGDLLGFALTGAGSAQCAYVAGTDLVRFSSTPDPAPGTTEPTGSTSGFRFTISAQVEADADNDGFGDESQDQDDDNDGLSDASEAGRGSNPLNGDSDGDGRGDTTDNCISQANPDQRDADDDGVGAACDTNDLRAGACENVRNGTSRGERIDGTPGGDLLSGRGRNDRLNGLAGDDCLFGGSGNDRVSGSSGKDQLEGGSGRDRLAGGSGNDQLDGGGGRNSYSGGAGRDSIDAVNGVRETVNCGSGRDTARVDRRDRVRRCERVRRSR